MEGIIQSIANGIMMGFIYVLVALGLSLVFSIMRIVQFAHGEIYMLGAYVVYFLCVGLGVPTFIAFAISALALALVGIILERYFFRRFRGDIENSIIVAIGLILLLQTIATVFFGTQEKYIPDFMPGIMNLWGIRLPWERMLAVWVGIIMTIALFIFIRATKTGQAMVAIAQDLEGAALQGINVNRISAIAMAIGCALAALAGALMGAIFQIEPAMGGFAMEKGIAVIILGGLEAFQVLL